MAKEIRLTQGYVAIVDDDDFERFGNVKWQVRKDGTRRTIYAGRRVWLGNGRRRNELLHRAILNAPEGCEVDHIDGNGLNCQRYNLRLATPTENRRNRGKPMTNTSGYKGVYWDTIDRKWKAEICVGGGKKKTIGRFSTIEEAADAYRKAAEKYHGDYAHY